MNKDLINIVRFKARHEENLHMKHLTYILWMGGKEASAWQHRCSLTEPRSERKKLRVFKMSDLRGWNSWCSGFALMFISRGQDSHHDERTIKVELCLTLATCLISEVLAKECLQSEHSVLHSNAVVWGVLSNEKHVEEEEEEHRRSIKANCKGMLLHVMYFVATFGGAFSPPGGYKTVYVHSSRSCCQLWY